MPIDVSNVLLVNPELGRGVRTGVRINEAGDKVRFCKKTGKELSVIRSAKKK
jgi:large subunit ribosomal protein L24